MIIIEWVDYGWLGCEIISYDVCVKKKNEKIFEMVVCV